MPLIKAIPPVRGRVGRPRKRPACLYADRGYDHDKYRRLVRRTGIKPIIARRGTPHGSGLGIHRWVVERTIAPALVPSLAHPLGGPRRHSRSLHDPRRRHHLLATPRPLIFVLGPLKIRDVKPRGHAN
ncbi:hypothetical protein GCM10022419_135290 [Nonomuraea rosea]|uniref:Transposase n=1 Tax=Nonomuraea rosea TaxID=638574 RepID=A0ABP7A8B6_9ACTN